MASTARAAMAAGLLVAAASLSSAWAAGPKSGGSTEIVDDLPTGAAATGQATSGLNSLEGSLGQVLGLAETLAAGTTIESGYFSRYVSTPANIQPSLLYATSATFTWAQPVAPNAPGTRYVIELATSADFGGTIYSSATYGSTATVTGLIPNTTGYARMSVGYMGGDDLLYIQAGSGTTRAMPPASAQSTFSAVATNGMTVSWDHNGNPVGVTTYTVVFSTNPTFQDLLLDVKKDTAPNSTPAALTELLALIPNTTYFVFANSRDHAGNQEAYTPLGSTVTLARPPSAAGVTFNEVFTASVSVSWFPNGNPVGSTRYEVALSTTLDFPNAYPGTVVFSTTPGAPLQTALVSGLASNTTYFLYIRAVNHGAVPSAYASFGSTVTIAMPPAVSSSTFSDLYQTSFTAHWDANGNGPGTLYEAIATTGTPSDVNNGADVTLSTRPFGAPAALFLPLWPNTTWYVWARTMNHGGAPSVPTFLGSTATLAELPGIQPQSFAVFASSVSAFWAALPPPWVQGSSHSAEGYLLEASSTNFGALAPGGSVFSSRTASGSEGTLSIAGLTPYTTYYFRVGSLNWNGTPNYAILGSTIPRQFTPFTPFAMGRNSSKIAAGDFDRDGDLDFAVANEGTGDEYVLVNQGNGTFTPIDLAGSGGDSTDVAWGDFDNDGDLDLAIANKNSEDEVIYRYDGAGVFTKIALAGSADSSFGAAWGDCDNDGDLDLAVSNQSAPESVFVNNGDGTFTKRSIGNLGTNSRGLAWGDYNNDGLLDLAVANGSSEDETLLTNVGKCTFAASQIVGTGGNSRRVAWGDADNDGDLDLAIANDANQDEVVAINNGNGTFTPMTLTGSAGSSQDAAWGDYDNDGDLDLLIANSVGQDEVLMRNDGSLVFRRIGLSGTGGDTRSAIWADYDNDGDLDIALANQGGEDERLARSDGISVNTPPGEPGGVDWSLEYSVFSSTLTVKWDGDALDGGFSTATINWSLAIATAPFTLSGDNLRVVSPSSGAYSWNGGSPLFGAYPRPAYRAWPGETLPKHGLVFRLDEGALRSDATYHFRLQAIDSSLARGVFDSIGLSTYVYRSQPPEGRTLSQVLASSLTVTYGPVGATAYFVEASSTNFAPGGAILSSGTGSQAGTALDLVGLSPNTTYFLRMGSLWQKTTSYASAAPASTCTLASEPDTWVSPFAAVGTASATVIWLPAGNPIGRTTYTVVLSTMPSFQDLAADFKLSTAPAGLPLAATFNGTLDANTTYFLHVAARNHAGAASAFVAMGSTVTLPREPAAAGAAFTSVVATAAAVQWSASVNPPGTRYEAALSTDTAFPNAFAFTRFASTAGAPNLSIGGLQPNTTYHLFVRAVGHGGFATPYVALGSTATLAQEPAATTTTFTAVHESSVAVAWDHNGNPVNVTSYTVVLSTGLYPNSFAGNRAVASTCPLGGAPEAVVAGLQPNTTYFAAVAAYNAAGTLSAFVQLGSTATLPSAPASAASTFSAVSSGALTAAWAANGNPAGTLYEAAVSTDLAFPNQHAYTQVKSTQPWGTPSVGFTSLAANTTFHFFARAIGVGGSPSAYAFLGSTVTKLNVLAVANPVFNSVFAGSATVTWGANGNPAGTLYEAVLTTGVGFPNGNVGNVTVSTRSYLTLPSVVFPALLANTTYQFLVRAIDHGGEPGPYFGMASTSTLADLPQSAPSTFAAVSFTSMTVAWLPGTNPVGVTTYTVVLSTLAVPNALDNPTLSTVPAGAPPSATLGGLAANTTYLLFIDAVNHVGRRTGYVALGSTVTLAREPAASSTTFTGVSGSAIAAAWSSNGNGPGTLYDAWLSTDTAVPNAHANTVHLTTRSYGVPALSFTALQPNTTYNLLVRTIAHDGSNTAFADLGVVVTLANEPVTAVTTFTAVHFTSASVAWGANGNPVGVTSYTVVLSTTASFQDLPSDVRLTTAPLGSPLAGTVGTLAPNTTYFLYVAARNQSGAPTAYLALGSTVTAAFPPDTVASTFSAVGANAFTAAWSANGNPAGTLYETAASTSTSFPNAFAGTVLASTRPSAAPAVDFGGVLANTTYFFFARAVNHAGAPSGYALLGSTSTRANAPVSAASTFSAVFMGSMTVAWGANGNSAGTVYEAVLTTGAVFPNFNAGNVPVSTQPFGSPGAAIGALTANTTYFLWVRAVGRGGEPTAYVQLGSTPTLADFPRDVISTFTIVGYSSMTVSWHPGSNPPGTVYNVVLSTLPLPNALDNPSLSTSPAPMPGNATLSSLAANTTYLLFIEAQNHAGLRTGFVAFGSTVTLVREPAGAAAAFPAVYATSAAVAWGENGNGAGTLYEASLSTDSQTVLTTTRPYGAPSVGMTGLLPNTTYTLSVRAIGHSGTSTLFIALGSTVTLANAPVAVATTFTAVRYTSMTVSWSHGGNPPAVTNYTVALSTDPAYPNAYAFTRTLSTAPANPSATLNGLLEDTLYYLFVGARNHAETPSAFAALGSTRTNSSVDTSSPTVLDNQAGDDAWVGAFAARSYDVDFTDTGGSLLDRFEIKASTVPGGGGPDVVAYTTVVSGIASNLYAANWSLPSSAFFDALWESATNYVSVRVRDGNGDTTIVNDAFYVRKDTTPPTIADNQGGVDAPQQAAGAVYDVDFFDVRSGLDRLQYSASLAPGGGAGVLPWTDIAGPLAGATYYTTNWGVDFAGLSGGTTYYISVRAWDTAGSTRTVNDAFYVVKDTGGPSIGITQPASAFRSSLSAISGTAADPLGVGGVQFAVRRVIGGLYWDGGSFTSAAALFFPVAGTVNWSTSAALSLSQGEQYDVIARGSDTAGNFTATYATRTFTLDGLPPAAGVGAPLADATITSLPTITGTATDANSGLASVEVQLRRNSDGLWWNWVSQGWQTVAVSSAASIGGVWNVTPSEVLRSNLAHQTSYFVAVRGTDNSVPANAGSFYSAGSSTFTFNDPGAPDPITAVTALAGPQAGQISLSWTAPGDDPGNAGRTLLGEFRINYSTYAAGFTPSTAAAQVIIATGSVIPGSTHGRVVTSLTPGNTYFLYVFMRDDAGNWSGASVQGSTLAMPGAINSITGHVMNTSSQGITAVLVEAFDTGGGLVASTFTVADGSGTFTLANLVLGSYKVQATWVANGIGSAVWQDNIPMGTADLDFVLSLNYTLSALTGTLQVFNGAAGLSAAGAGVGPTPFGVASAGSFSSASVELFQSGRQVAAVSANPAGRWLIPNLLPGRYAVRARVGYEATPFQEVDLLEGEVRDIGFNFSPLAEKDVYAFPNPARDGTTIRFESSLWPLEAQVSIFDVAGALVREIPGAEIKSPSTGRYHAAWDLRNSNGEPVASGVYLFMVKVRAGPDGQSGKVIKKLAVIR